MLQQQHPSPARLGLTTTTNAPNSPSIPPPSSSSSSSYNTPTPPNPKPPPLPSIATTATATTTTTTITATTTTSNRLSPSLLPLLPPLPRAHSLLLQLSSLSSHLFDSSPKQPPCFLPPPTPIPPYPLLPNPPSSSSISSIHSQLLSSVQDLQSILQFRDSLSSVSRCISTVDSSLLSFARKMNDARQLLDNLLDDYSHYRVPTKRRKTDSSSSTSSTSSFSPLAIPLDDLLSYAHRISYTTFAPPEFGAGQVPLRGALPPAPQEEQMRASQLYNAAATIDLGIARVEGAGDGVAAGKPLLESLIEPTPPREELAPQPPGIPPISVPAGWRKGMPIDLPKDLPPLPPGWKPGDPIQLPPMLEASIGGGKLEEQPRLPVAAAAVAAGGAPPVVQPRQPEPIQVKYVQLDINAEDDYSSDYSSDASSDEDDED